jgi:2-polyprenyl-3-methyl-5-hydroxy-6-metoxy-1,4-benzoquinol methylase
VFLWRKNAVSSRKSTACGYGNEYRLKQVEKYRNRRDNAWRHRINLARKLVAEYALPRHQGKPISDLVLVDVGCSVGTFAIEFAKIGYHAYGIDFDRTSIEIARQLAHEENVSPEFICGDVTNWKVRFPEIDVAICFDIFEHLHDDQLGSLLNAVKEQFSTQGSLVFNTYPTQYNHIFYRRGYVRWPLVPFVPLSPSKFQRVAEAYAALLDIIRILTKGCTHAQSIRWRRHCNPTSMDRLAGILERAGYDVLILESSNLYRPKHMLQKYFSRQPITHRNIYGVAVPKDKDPKTC